MALWKQLLAVALGGAVGACLRYGITVWIHRRVSGPFPWGTLAVNLLGCLLIGALMVLALRRGPSADGWRLFAVTGILGSLTTFSTFGYETVTLLRDDELRKALTSIALNLGIGLPSVALGAALMRWFLGPPPGA